MAISGPELLTSTHDASQFSCGKPSLDRWLRTHALSNQQKGFTAVLVVHEANRIIGYYGLAPTAVLPSTLPRSIRTGQPPNPVPACCSDNWPRIRTGSARELGPGCSTMRCSVASQPQNSSADAR